MLFLTSSQWHQNTERKADCINNLSVFASLMCGTCSGRRRNASPVAAAVSSSHTSAQQQLPTVSSYFRATVCKTVRPVATNYFYIPVSRQKC